MTKDKLISQINSLKITCIKWEKELSNYVNWFNKYGFLIPLFEDTLIKHLKNEINNIKIQISKIEASIDTKNVKNKLGITQEEVKSKLNNFFSAFDKITVTVNNKTVEVETPYFMNEGGGGKFVDVGKGSPKDVQKWLQHKINSGEIKSDNPNELRNFLLKHKIGIDCSGFVSQALNHLADKQQDMIYGNDDIFKPNERYSASFGPEGREFKKILPENVQIGDTLFYDNPKKDGANHVRIVGDVRKVSEVFFYTIYESANHVGPRKMEWKFDGTLQEFRDNAWIIKVDECFYRWKKLEINATESRKKATKK